MRDAALFVLKRMVAASLLAPRSGSWWCQSMLPISSKGAKITRAQLITTQPLVRPLDLEKSKRRPELHFRAIQDKKRTLLAVCELNNLISRDSWPLCRYSFTHYGFVCAERPLRVVQVIEWIYQSHTGVRGRLWHRTLLIRCSAHSNVTWLCD